MSAPLRLEQSYRVRFDEAGPDGNLPAAGFLRYAQDLAWVHSEIAGLGRDWYGSRGLTWLARAIALDVLGEVTYGTELEVSTELIGFHRVWARRLSEFRQPGADVPAGRSITDWVLVNAAGRPVRPPPEILRGFFPQPPDFSPMRLADQAPPPAAPAHESTVRRGELDPMAHLNNAAYLDYLDEHYLDVAGHPALPPRRRYEVEFLAPAAVGTRVTGIGWADGADWCYRLDAAGRELFRARLKTLS